MKRFGAKLFLMLALAAPGLAQNPGGAPAGPPPAVEPELPSSDLLVRYEAPILSFRWALAPEAALEPKLVRTMRSEALTERTKAIRDAEAGAKATAAADGRKLQYQWTERWQLEAETDLLLVLSTKQYSFTGGAHGNIVYRSIIWDRGVNQRISFAELFDDPKAAMAALKPAFCKALDAERAVRRGGQPNAAFSDCPDPSAYPIVPTGEGNITGFRVLVPPYEAGPWVEGTYEIGLDAALLKPFVRKRYAAAFTNW